MTRSLCLVFEARVPLSLRWYWPAEENHDMDMGALYFDREGQEKAFGELLEKAYLPVNEILEGLAGGGARFSLKLDGSFLDLCHHNDEALRSFKCLAASGGIELLGAPYYSTLSCFFDRYKELKDIVAVHKNALAGLFGCLPATFANTGLIFNSRIGQVIKGMGFKRAIVGAEGKSLVSGYLTESGVLALPVHTRLSADIGDRFSDREWACYPLTADTYASWIARVPGDLTVVYVEYGAFGVAHGKKSGIFKFLEKLPMALEERGIDLITPSEYDCPEIDYSGIYDTVSMAPIDEILGNHMQHLYFNEIKRLQPEVSNCPGEYLDIWRRLQTADILADMAATRPWHPWDKAVSNILLLSDFKRRVIEAMR